VLRAIERLLRPATLLRSEGAVMLAASILCYQRLGASWLLFALLLLFPDLGALGYLAGGRLGAACYNATHTLTLPAALVVFGIVTGGALPLTVATIWFAHIGMDRVLGYGLKEVVPTRRDSARPITLGLPITR